MIRRGQSIGIVERRDPMTSFHNRTQPTTCGSADFCCGHRLSCVMLFAVHMFRLPFLVQWNNIHDVTHSIHKLPCGVNHGNGLYISDFPVIEPVAALRFEHSPIQPNACESRIERRRNFIVLYYFSFVYSYGLL